MINDSNVLENNDQMVFEENENTNNAAILIENLYKAYKDGNNLEARKNMLEASYLAGCAFTVSYVGYCHAISHSLSGMYNTPHGLANAVIIPYILEAYDKKIYKK